MGQTEKNQERLKCSECGGLFSSEEMLRNHFKIEHPKSVYEGPAVDKKSLEYYWKQVKPFLNTSFGIGFTVGVLLTCAVFGVNALVTMGSGGVPVEVTVLTCDNCSYEGFQTRTDLLFNAEYRNIDYQSDEAQKMIDKYDIRYIPAFIFDKKVEEAANFSRAESSLVEFEDAYVLEDGEGESARFLSNGKSLN